MNLLNLFKKKEPEIKAETIIDTVFVSIPCDCGESITLFEDILPGQAAVTRCENCDLSWTIFNPSLVVRKTKELPENLQKVWRELANEPI